MLLSKDAKFRLTHALTDPEAAQQIIDALEKEFQAKFNALLDRLDNDPNVSFNNYLELFEVKDI